MSIYAIYEVKSGEIKRIIHTQEDHLLQNIQLGESYLPINAGESDNTHYVIDGVITPYTTEELTLKNGRKFGFVWKMPERILIDTRALKDARDQKWQQIKSNRDVAINSPFAYNGNIYDPNIQNINNAVLSNITSNTISLDWTTATNTTVTLSSSEINELGKALHIHINAAHDKARALRKQIYDDSKTIAQVDAINW